MHRRLLALTVAATAFAGLLGSVGCNAILDNEEATLAADGGELDAASDATTGPPADRDATVGDAANAADARPGDAALDGPVSVADAGDGGGIFDPPTCGSGQKLCDGTCVSIDNPVYGCDETSCSPCSLSRGVAVCSGNSCVLGSCNAGYADCDLDASDGCEVDLSLPAHCGSCNAACGTAAPDCSPINGTFECITNCQPPQPTLCNGTCVDLTSSAANCGQCGVPCPAVANGTTSCSDSTCAFSCTAPYLKCGAGCVAPNDPTACGPACTACTPPAHANATCPASSCSFTCKAGYGDCDMDPTNGCETMLVDKMCPVDAGADAGDSGT
jgi:hypothetical protein